MKTASLYTDLVYQEDKPVIKVLLETEFTKEIRIAMKKGNVMKKHQTKFPIVVEIAEGAIDFGVEDQMLSLTKGDLIALDGGVPHDLLATADSVVRLTLSKSDQASRVRKVVD